MLQEKQNKIAKEKFNIDQYNKDKYNIKQLPSYLHTYVHTCGHGRNRLDDTIF